MPDSYYMKLLLDGKANILRELAALASKERPTDAAKRFAAEAQILLRNLAELDEKLLANDGPGGLDYREDVEINVSIIRFLAQIGRPAKNDELTKELIRGQFPGYKDMKSMGIRVGRCIRSYVVGKPSENPKLKVKNNLVGLPDWPDEMFQV